MCRAGRWSPCRGERERQQEMRWQAGRRPGPARRAEDLDADEDDRRGHQRQQLRSIAHDEAQILGRDRDRTRRGRDAGARLGPGRARPLPSHACRRGGRPRTASASAAPPHGEHGERARERDAVAAHERRQRTHQRRARCPGDDVAPGRDRGGERARRAQDPGARHPERRASVSAAPRRSAIQTVRRPRGGA